MRASRRRLGFVTNEIPAHRKKVDLNKWDKALDVIETLGPSLPPL